MKDNQLLQPIHTLRDFFDNCPAEEATRLLTEMKEAALIAHCTGFDNADNRRYLLWFCRELADVLAAAMAICRQTGP